jgi:histidinol phosphatase-like enzyme (inositol monophosphatase family)
MPAQHGYLVTATPRENGALGSEVNMTTLPLAQYLDFAIDAAWQAGRLTLQHFQAGVAVERKPDRSVVTVADKGAEELLRRLIEGRFPDHAIAGEELGSDDKDSTHRWIIDPIDGTQSFVRGVPLYGVLLGLEIEGEMAVGVAHYPALDDMLAAATGLGCRWNGRPVRVSAVGRLEDALLCHADVGELTRRSPTQWERLRAATPVPRGFGDCYGYALVATGRAEIMVDPIVNPWDIAALVPILREAGGTLTDWSGQTRLDGGNAFATNGVLFEPVLELLQG